MNDTKTITLVRLRIKYGTLYGVCAGLFFALCLWGYDSVMLARAHAFYPFLKLLLGAICFALVYGLVGWLTARLGIMVVGLVSWLLAAWAIAWLTIYIPLKMVPLLMGWFKPDMQAWLSYPIYPEFGARVFGTFVLLAIFSGFLGLFENLLVEPASHAVALISRFVPFLVCFVAMVLAGLMMDEFVSQPMRAPIVAMDKLIQFSLDHRGETIDAETARKMHLGSLRLIEDLLDRPRRLVMGSYDETFGIVDVMVDFDGEWADCNVFYEQASICKPVTSP
jgi:hypothetical protein